MTEAITEYRNENTKDIDLLSTIDMVRKMNEEDTIVAKVVGDGSCVVTFKIANNGQLINRNFAVQSENTSLNDVVYNAVMQTPYVSAPPQSYKGETLRLSVKIYGGSFEVALN